MSETILVDFHCHSIFSDGELSPGTLAAGLAAAGVRFASLTDHDSIEGIAQFKSELNKYGIPCISGVELTTQYLGNEVHLLGYGFDPENQELNVTLASIRQTRSLEVYSIASSLRKAGTNRSKDNSASLVFNAAPNGHLEIKDAFRLIHQAGGLVFLAHPLTLESDPVRLETLVSTLKVAGLDGIEAYNGSFTLEEQEVLFTIAEKYALLVSAGTDYHSLNGPGSSTFGVALNRELWNQFRIAIFASEAKKLTNSAEEHMMNESAQKRAQSIKEHHFKKRSYMLRIVLPTLFAIVLFLIAFWGFILPSVEQTLLDRKREMIRELTNSAWSILVSYHDDEQSGILTRGEAQKLAADRIESLRYGPEGKDYFWIQDSTPRMIMHPYRADLNNKDLSNLLDSRGVPIFVEFAAVVKSEGEGYVDYVWQWKDEPQRLEPKESFVKGFEPWGWIIGTGIYIDDVQGEIANIEKNLVLTSLIVFGVIVILLLFVLQQSLRIEKERQEVLNSLHDSTERYHSLIEATTEGTLLVLDNRCRYANPIFLQMTGYSNEQLEYLELANVLPEIEENSVIRLGFQSKNEDRIPEAEAHEGNIKKADGNYVECVISLNPIQISGQDGFILLAKEINRQPEALNYQGLAAAAQHASVGIFRAHATGQGNFVEVNSLIEAFLPEIENDTVSPPALADLFSEPEQYEQFHKHLLSQEEIPEYIALLTGKDGIKQYIAISAKLMRDENGHPEFIDGTIRDVSNVRKQESSREELIGKLQASLLFLHEPLSSLGKDVLICKMDTSIEKLAAKMTSRKLTAALVESEAGIVIGMVTDQDLRSRVLAVKGNLQAPIHTIMSAPLVKVFESTPLYEALMVMEEKGVRHLAVENKDGQIINIVDSKTLVQFHRYGAVVLTREIGRAETQEDIAQICDQIPHLVDSILESSTRPRYASGMLASIADAATVRIIQLAIAEVGEPPADFSFISMGSQGRQEQTLLTDQDNGIIFQPESGVDATKIQEYFLSLGARVNDGLYKAGYDLCQGNVMAKNPLWCKPLADWKKGFTDWVFKAEPQELINICIFLDFHSIYGNTVLADELRKHVNLALHHENALYPLLAHNALSFKPPFRLIGNIYLGKGSSEHAGEIDLKDAMLPIVSFARLYSLQNNLQQTNTIERINTLAEHHIINPSSRDQITASFDFLMQLRLHKQVQAVREGTHPTNSIHPGQLGYMQQELLKQAFEQISAVQKKISYDFLGGV